MSTNQYSEFRESNTALVLMYKNIRKLAPNGSCNCIVKKSFVDAVNNILVNDANIKYFIIYFKLWHLCLLNQEWYKNINIQHELSIRTNKDSDEVSIEITYVPPKGNFTKVTNGKGYRNETKRDESEHIKPAFNLYTNKDHIIKCNEVYSNINSTIQHIIHTQNNEVVKSLLIPIDLNKILQAFNMEEIQNEANQTTFITFICAIERKFLIYYFGEAIIRKFSEGKNNYKLIYYDSANCTWKCLQIGDMPVGYAKVEFEYSNEYRRTVKVELPRQPHFAGRGRGRVNGNRQQRYENTYSLTSRQYSNQRDRNSQYVVQESEFQDEAQSLNVSKSQSVSDIEADLEMEIENEVNIDI